MMNDRIRAHRRIRPLDIGPDEEHQARRREEERQRQRWQRLDDRTLQLLAAEMPAVLEYLRRKGAGGA